MSDVIAEFIAALNFKVETKELDEAGKKAKEAAEKSQKAWREFGTTIRNVGLAALGAVGGLIAFAENAAGSAAAIDDVANRTGAARSELQRLAFAAKQSGAANGLQAIESALKALDIQLVKGAKDTGPAAEALRALGLTTTELIDLPAEAKFAKIAEAIAKVENPALQTQIALKLFGGAGQELIPLLAEGATGIKKLGDEAEKAGLVLNDAAIQGAAKFDDEIGKAKAEAAAFARDMGMTLIPLVRNGIRDFKSWAVAAGGLATAIAGIKLVQLPGQLGLAASGMTTLALRTAGATTAALGLGVALGVALDNALGLSDAIAGVDQQKGGRGAVAIGGMTAEEATRLAAAQARLKKAEEASFFSPDAAFSKLEANAARAEIDAVQNAVRGRAAHAGKFQSVIDQSDKIVGRHLGEGAAQRGFDSAAKANKLLADRSKKKGGAKKKFEEDITAGMIEADDAFGEELRMLAARHGVNETGIDAALKAAAEATAGGSNTNVARQAALSALGSKAGVDLTTKREKDPLLSQIFGDENVPDVELSAIARGAEPQVLISHITNTFHFDIDQQIDGTGDPQEVAERTAAEIRNFSRESVAKATKTAKLIWAG